MSEIRFSDTPQVKIVWRSVPGRRDCIRSDDWRIIIRRVWDDGATLFQLWDAAAMLEGAGQDREHWRLVQWCADADDARQAAEEYLSGLQDRARIDAGASGKGKA